MTTRSGWVDAAKGGAITLVVFGHVWRGLYLKDLVPKETFRSIDAAIYAFHMPLFFMISGFFFFHLARGEVLRIQILNITRRLLVPLMLWTYIFLFIRWVFSDFTNARPDVTSLFVLPVPGILHFWFLWALWVIQIGFLLLVACFPRRWCGMGQAATALLLVSGMIWQYAPDLPLRAYLAQAYEHAVYFAMGAVLFPLMEASRTHRIVAVLAAAGLVGLILLTQIPAQSRLFAALLALGLSVSFLVVVKEVSFLAPRGLRLLQWVGVFSFSIYMMHTIFSAGLREILLLAGVTQQSLHLIFGLMVGILCPICISIIAARYGVGASLGLRVASWRLA